MNAIKAITPAEAANAHATNIPDFVIEVVNKLISSAFSGSNSFVITQKRIVEEIIKDNHNIPHISSRLIFDNNWLDFEPLFEKAGWDVEFDKPGYNESYEVFFRFTPKKK